MFGILVAAAASAVIALYFWKALRPLRRGAPPQCVGCSGCSGKDASPENCPKTGKNLYEIAHVQPRNEPQEP